MRLYHADAMRRTRAAALTTLAAIAPLAGCGGGSSTSSSSRSATSAPLDTHKVATAIQQSILRERNVHARVNCPRHMIKRKHWHFVCIATTSAGQTPFVVTEVNDSGAVSYVGK